MFVQTCLWQRVLIFQPLILLTKQSSFNEMSNRSIIRCEAVLTMKFSLSQNEDI